MKTTKFKYIHFEEVDSTGKKTSVWQCVNNKSFDQLGRIKWYGPWRQYCVYTDGYVIFNKGCMEDINYFITQLMDERKSK